MHSAVLILPKELKEAGDKIGEVMGWGPESYTISLTSNPDGEVTHVGLRADVYPSFIRMIEDAKQGRYPNGVSETLLASVIDALIADFSPDPSDPEKPVLWGADHLDRVCMENNLYKQ